MALLHSIGKSRIGDLARTCGLSIKNIANPLGIMVSVKISGLEEEVFFDGPERYRAAIKSALENYGLTSTDKAASPPSFVSITTDEGKTICIGVIRHLGNPIGYAAALSDIGAEENLPLSETVWLCVNHMTMRLGTILSPANQSAAELLGRQLLTSLNGDGVRTLTIGTRAGDDAWLSLNKSGERIAVREVERLPKEQVANISDGEIIGENTLKYLWSDSDVAIGVWVSSDAGYYLALGFEDRKLLNPGIMNRVKEQIEAKAKDDAAYLIKSFENLKADFKDLGISERAAAITETTVTVNHEINNPLTAILGNTQLLLMGKDKLPADVVAKLQTIERSAIKIRETTTKLMSIIEPVTSSYASGLEMIDIEKSKKKKTQ